MRMTTDAAASAPNQASEPDTEAWFSSNPVLADRSFFGHPRGLATLAFTEGFIAFSYYGMQSLLMLYMLGALLTPAHIGHVFGLSVFRQGLSFLYGPLAGQPLAAAIMGVYAATVYATPILGGLLADRWLGRSRTIVLGSVLMTLGHFLMAFDASFLIALFCLVVGTGCAGGLKAQVGGFYARNDNRRSDAFQIYVLSVQLAVIVAPLICGTLGEKVDWRLGFGAAGLGMLIGLVIYLAGLKRLPPEPVRPATFDRTARQKFSSTEVKTLAVLTLIIPVMAVAAVGNMEIFNGYLVWGAHAYQLVFFGQVMPVSWLLSMDAFISTFTLTASVVFWRWRAKRGKDPNEITKVALGAAISALGPLILALASLQLAHGVKVGLVWGLAFHLINNLGFANMYGVGMALFSRAAPKQLGATVVNAFSLHLFLSNLLVGGLAGRLNQMSNVQFWLLHAGLIAAAAVVLAILARLFRNLLAPSPTEAATDFR